ncbi:acyltransferase family protein [Flavobacterium sp. PLA-1-15]|uniref:acyltransferase family protein n=1 Tax=Flavobacterium sp. PLA-1-15 TaxID=3380533 RepID=UPI003B79A914
MSKNNFPALTGIRAVAAYMVYIHHTNPFSKTMFNGSLYGFFEQFHIGVTVFFVLSGFLIAHRYYDESSFNFKSYLIKRFARIYPMYFMLTSVVFLFGFMYSENPASVENYLLNITFLRGFFDDLKFSGIAQGWTLTVEEMFYLFAPLFFLFIKRSKLALLVIPIFFGLLGLILVHIFKGINFHGFMGSESFMFDYTFFGRISEFFVGITLALFIKKKDNYDVRFKYFTLLGTIGIIAGLYLLSVLKYSINHEMLKTTETIIINILIPILGIVPLFYGLIYEKTLISTILSTRLFLLLGKSSYVFYLIHIGIFANLMAKIADNYLFLFLSLNLIAIGLYQFVEKPFNLFFRKNVH